MIDNKLTSLTNIIVELTDKKDLTGLESKLNQLAAMVIHKLYSVNDLNNIVEIIELLRTTQTNIIAAFKGEQHLIPEQVISELSAMIRICSKFIALKEDSTI